MLKPQPATCFMRLAALACFTALAIPAHANGLFIPAEGRVDALADGRSGIVYISSDSGEILRFDLLSNMFLDPVAVGGEPRGLTLSPDGRTLVSADDRIESDVSNWIHVIDTATGTFETIRFDLAFGESGTHTAAFVDDDTLLISSEFSGSGWVPLRQLTLSSGDVTTLASVRQRTMLATSADRSVVAYAESNISSGEFGLYDVADGTFNESGTGAFNFEVGVSRDGAQIAVPSFSGMRLFDPVFNEVGILGDSGVELPIGVAYSPVADLLYTAWSGADASVQVHDVDTLQQVAVIDEGLGLDWIGNFPFREGRLRISGEGALLTVTMDGGVTVYPVGAATEPNVLIRPRQEINWVSLSRHGTVPVLLLGAPGFFVNQVDEASLAFGPGGAPVTSSTIADLNNDGREDLFLRFDVGASGLELGGTSACVSGTVLATPFAGCDDVRVVP
ncbi:MAG: hypothetical protein AAF184_09530 [Pseudomonadota bacterium]